MANGVFITYINTYIHACIPEAQASDTVNYLAFKTDGI